MSKLAFRPLWQALRRRLMLPLQLHQAGVLGMNARNRLYISRYNPRTLYPLVDNKLKTKRLAEQAGIAVPELIGTIQSQHEVETLGQQLSGIPAFVIKPAKGSGGKGIVVVQSCEGDYWVRANGSPIMLSELKRHASNILAGLHSLGGSPDVAIIERCIQFDDSLQRFSYEGVPDVRVIVCRGYPVMAMTRLATRASDGKANLHQGAVGVGLGLANGQALHGVQNGLPMMQHPDTQEKLSELFIPQWQDLLVLAARCYDMTGLGYLGADIVIDRQHGPLLLELNARPGLAIQLANGAGLLPRLKVIDALAAADLQRPAEERVALCQQWFGAGHLGAACGMEDHFESGTDRL
ncbi:alpha-L-glutamate ligase-like protein [Oceanobacter sp. 3_MG-2023]|uniref:alpha-L-glutamate ligase-like protein n=1 Tax=Oceanobacter sp. 3_MG-2023 TaxID=3062622 RepID=UPI00351E54FE